MAPSTSYDRCRCGRVESLPTTAPFCSWDSCCCCNVLLPGDWQQLSFERAPSAYHTQAHKRSQLEQQQLTAHSRQRGPRGCSLTPTPRDYIAAGASLLLLPPLSRCAAKLEKEAAFAAVLSCPRPERSQSSCSNPPPLKSYIEEL